MRHSRKRGLITAGILTVILLSSTVYAQFGYPITACGTLKDGLYCRLFSPFSGGIYLLDNYGTFGVGDTVQVSGYYDPYDPYQCWCVTFQYPCIRQNTIIDGVSACFPNVVCGSFDCDSLVDSTDYLLAKNYLEGGAYPLQCPEIADFDGYLLYTVHDLALLSDSIYRHTGTAQCPPGLPPFAPPVSAGDYLSYSPATIAAGVTELAITINLTVSDTSDWFNIPFKIGIGSSHITVDSITSTLNWNVVDNYDGHLWLRDWGTRLVPSSTYPQPENEICKVYVSVESSEYLRSIIIALESLGPEQQGHLVNTPMIIRSYIGRPSVRPTVFEPTPSHSPRTLYVASEFPNIQSAIEYSVNDDTILVAPGTYNENIDFIGRKLIIRSSNGRSQTEIHGTSNSLATVSLLSGEPQGTILNGFKITGGGAAGIACSQSSPSIINCEITANHNYDYGIVDDGGGITMVSCTAATIRQNIFHDNVAFTYGGAVHMRNCRDISISYNLAYDNDAYAEFRGVTSTGLFCNNTVSITRSAGLELRKGGHFEALNNIIFFSDDNAALWASHLEGGTIANDYNCLFANDLNSDVPLGPHTILADAQFIDSAGRNYHLRPTSPCIDAGDPDPAYNDSNGTRNDIGAIPFTENCCFDSRGNVNLVGVIDLADLSALVSYLSGGGYSLPCPDAANADGQGIVDLADLSALVSYLTGGGFVLLPCG